MKRFSKKNDVVYVLDFSGSLLKETTFEGAIEYTGVSGNLIYESIRRNSLVNSKYIFSKTRETIVNTRYTHNPLFGTIPSEIVNEFMVQQRAWERGVHEMSDADRISEKEGARRWSIIVEENRKNRAKKQREYERNIKSQKISPLHRIEDADTEVNKTHSGSSMLEEMKQDAMDNVVDAILKDKKFQEAIKIIEPFIKPFLNNFIKKLNNDEVRTMQFMDKKTGLLCFLDMKTENIKQFEVSGITKDNLLTIDPQEARRGNTKYIIESIIKKFGLY